MNENPRDTQFQGFAKLVAQELMRSNAADKVDVDRFWDEDNIAEVELLLARRAYDLVEHVVVSESPIAHQCMDDGEIVASIPDLIELPEESE